MQHASMLATVVPCGYAALFVGPVVSVPGLGAVHTRLAGADGAHQSFSSSAKLTLSS